VGEGRVFAEERGIKGGGGERRVGSRPSHLPGRISSMLPI
jgi:hypothetical protein